MFRYTRGIERFTWELSAALARNGVEIDILTWDEHNPLNWGEVPPNVAVKKVPRFRYFMALAAAPYYAAWMIRRRYDWTLFFFAGYGEGYAVRILRWFHSFRYCLVFHFPVELVPHRFDEFARHKLQERATLLIGVSALVANGAGARFGRECVVIPNGVDPARFARSLSTRDTVREQLGISKHAPVLITLAALEERKGIQWVIRAVARLQRHFPEITYLVVGSGPHRAALQDESLRLGLQKHIKFLGARTNVVELLDASDIGCLLSRGEAFGIALLEFMAMELPVVTSSRPPFSEFVQPQWGRLVDEEDSGQVVEVLASLLRDPAQRSSMGKAGREYVLHAYTWDCIAQQYLQHFGGLETS
jgi:glycosyltransferase involved in cell wall biosynthesis